MHFLIIGRSIPRLQVLEEHALTGITYLSLWRTPEEALALMERCKLADDWKEIFRKIVNDLTDEPIDGVFVHEDVIQTPNQQEVMGDVLSGLGLDSYIQFS